MNGKESGFVEVTSGVPQGSVLGPLLFLLYINDISEGVSSCMRMFADDCIIYREITAENDVLQIQSDLDKIQAWCEKWEMKLNLDKTVCMKFTRKKITRHLSYTIKNATLSPVTEYKYLGVYFTPSLCWHRQVDYTVAKASRALGFLRRNTCDFPQAVKALLYKSNVRSVLEYACTVWDPPTVIDKQKLERVQNLAVRYVLGKHARNKEYSATFSIQTLQWEILEHRRSKLCLKLFHEIYFSKTGVLREEYIASPHYTSARMDHAYKVREYKCNTASFASSFFPKTIRQWNRLSSAVVSRIGSNSFYDALSETALSTKKN